MLLIPPEALTRLRIRQALLVQLQLQLQDAQDGIRAEVAALGIDLDDGEWELDLDRGIVTRKETSDADAVDQAE